MAYVTLDDLRKKGITGASYDMQNNAWQVSGGSQADRAYYAELVKQAQGLMESLGIKPDAVSSFSADSGDFSRPYYSSDLIERTLNERGLQMGVDPSRSKGTLGGSGSWTLQMGLLDSSGNPVQEFQTGEKSIGSSFFKGFVAPFAQIILTGNTLANLISPGAVAAAGGINPSVIGQTIAAGAPPAVQSAVTNAVVSGSITALSGGDAEDVIKNALIGGATGAIGEMVKPYVQDAINFVKDLTPEGLQDVVAAAGDAGDVAGSVGDVDVGGTVRPPYTMSSGMAEELGYVGAGSPPGYVNTTGVDPFALGTGAVTDAATGAVTDAATGAVTDAATGVTSQGGPLYSLSDSAAVTPGGISGDVSGGTGVSTNTTGGTGLDTSGLALGGTLGAGAAVGSVLPVGSAAAAGSALGTGSTASSLLTPTVIAGGANLIGSVVAADAAQDAANAQTNAYTEAARIQAESAKEVARLLIEADKSAYERQLAERKPLQDIGMGALRRIEAGLAPGGEFARPFEMGDITGSERYKTLLESGRGAIEQSAFTRGMGMSTPAAMSVVDLGQRLGVSEYDRTLAQLQSEREALLRPLQSLAGIGVTETRALGDIAAQSAQNVGQAAAGAAGSTGSTTANALLAGAGASAAGRLQSGNIMGQAISDLGNMALRMDYLNRIFGGSSNIPMGS